MFTWRPIYKEIAQKLITYRDDRAPLLQLLREMKELGMPVVMIEDQYADGTSGPLKDIDPFTFFASFNRQSGEASRKAILSHIKSAWSLAAPVPEDFHSIPILQPKASWFFGYTREREPSAIDDLWELAHQVLHREPSQLDRALLDRCLTIKYVGLAKLTMGMFWLAPDRFIATDRINLDWFADQGITRPQPSAEDYFRFLTEVREKISDDFTDLSHRAYIASRTRTSDHSGTGGGDINGADDEDKAVPAGDFVRQPYFPGQAVVSGFVRIADGIRRSTIHELSRQLDKHIGTPESTTDWRQPDSWIPERLDGVARDLATRIWNESRHVVNPRHFHGAYRTAVNYALITLDQERVYRLTELGRRYVNGDRPARARLDQGEGIAHLLQMIESRKNASRADLLPEWSHLLEGRSKFKTEVTIADTLGRRIIDLRDRGYIEKSGQQWHVTPDGREYLLYLTANGFLELPARAIPTEQLHPDLRAVFLDRSEAAVAFELLRRACAKLNIQSPNDERFSINPSLGGKGIHFSFANWPLVRFYAEGKRETRMRLTLPASAGQALGLKQSREGKPFMAPFGASIEGDQFGQFWIEGPRIVPLEADLATAFDTGLVDIARLFTRQKRSPFRKYASPKMTEALFADDALSDLLTNGFGTDAVVSEIETPPAHLQSQEDGHPVVQHPVVSLSDIVARTGVPESQLTRWMAAIHRKGQAIIYGPPGTGKTFVARHLAWHLVGGSDGVLELVQFHPAYAYEDFVQGIRPQSKGGALSYPLMPGRFLEFCELARQREGLSVLIIDEINRANLARVFGELMYLLEYRDQEVPLAAGERFSIPSNVRIIGTMNTADRSIALVDHALRRRFAFLELKPSYETLRRFHSGRDSAALAVVVADKLQALNAEFGDPHFEIGISYFLRDELAKELPDIWKMEIEPYLQEYFFDRPEVVEKYRWEKLSGAFDGNN